VRTFVRIVIWLSVAFAIVSAAAVLLYRFVPPPGTPLMVIRKFDDRYSGRVNFRWVSLRSISRNVLRAAIAAEDARFCQHNGFDFEAIKKALEEDRDGGPRGASTITQQTAKNLFLWPYRDWVRKGLEAWFAVLMELLWTKDRILETYLNVAEWGDGIYGIESAARRYFRRSAASLTRQQAAYLVAVLPNARVFSPVSPGRVTRARAGLILRRMNAVALGSRRVCP